MITITDGKWISDLGSMTCRNIAYNIIVSFKKNGNVFLGEIQDMPLELLDEWAGKPEGEQKIRQAVRDAEAVFTRAWYESQIEKNNPDS